MCQKLCFIDRTVTRFTSMWTDSLRASVTQPLLKAPAFFTVVFCLHDLIHQINAINPRHLFLERLLYTMCTLVVKHRDCMSSLVCSDNNVTSGKVNTGEEVGTVDGLLLLNQNIWGPWQQGLCTVGSYMLLLFFKILCDTTVESEISFFTFLIPSLDLFVTFF